MLGSLLLPLPPLEEQRRIAAILDQAETLRTQRRQALAHLDTLTQSLFLDMFGDPATNSNSWPVKTLKELGKVITGGTPPSSKEGMFDGPIPFITPGDLESSEPVRRSITEAGAKEVDVVRAGSTLVCCIGATIGKVGMALKESAFNQQLNAVVWGGDIDDHFGYEVMRFFKPTIVSWGASTSYAIKPLLADAFPQLFEGWACQVTALELERTFWEKATILHAEFHRPVESPTPTRYARHYFDMAKLLGHPHAARYLADKAQCQRVVDWKSRVFARGWARYDLAAHGTFRLTPSPQRQADLAQDYATMRPMFMTEPPPFADLMQRLAEAEATLNAQ
jgi:hypothetical protein